MYCTYPRWAGVAAHTWDVPHDTPGDAAQESQPVIPGEKRRETMRTISLNQWDNLKWAGKPQGRKHSRFSAVDLAGLMGTRLVVVAARLECETPLQRDLHSRLVFALDRKISRMRQILAMQRDEDENERWLAGQSFDSWHENEEIALLDAVDVDADTFEYRVNDGNWRRGRPTREPVSREDLGPLVELFRLVAAETPFHVTAKHIY
uniref:Uncharacterized protein n=1 Tax=Ochrobactrum sp. LM19 TaxID=1449781 RepID=A0A0D5A1F6_9HYPH|nr:hypothetical protein [Ochrobactrum sp. LM19]AJW30033.1 hypothetical protein pLM19O2_p88 [Ochrobactrum sp. LM19]